jgi:hypothetical protein
MESEEVENQEYERTNVEFSNGYSTSTSQSNTGAVSLSGAYLNAEGGGSTEGDKPKNTTKLPTLEQVISKPHLNPKGDGISTDYTLEGIYIGQKTFEFFGKLWGSLFGKAVSSVSGGAWVVTNESMSVAAAEYQTFITGRAANQSYLLRGVKFDGLIDDVLIDAKSGYGNFVKKGGDEFQKWFTGKEGLIDQARRQIGAADGAKIQWYFQNNAAMQATQKLFNREGLKGIELIFKPN